jgi:DNA repair protein RecN (Recombination protein N)
MLKSLYIKNFTIIEEIEIEFKGGLNIITGGSGSGKSILISAIGQICGDRSSPDLVRKNSNKSIIEARISVKPNDGLINILKENEIEFDGSGDIIIRKEIYAAGSTRLFFNDSPINMTRLNKISALLIDIHGQHQHQRLLHAEYHIDYLDSFAQLGLMKENFTFLLDSYQESSKQLQSLIKKSKNSAEKQDLYRYQYDELSNANLDIEEYEHIKTEYNRGLNMETIHEHCSGLINALYEGENSAGDNLVNGERALEKLAAFDKEFGLLKESLQGARETVEEIGRFAESYLSNLSFDPERMETMRQRIAQIEFFLKKYNKNDLPELINYKEELKDRLHSIGNFEEDIKNAQLKVDSLVNEINTMGLKLSRERKEKALLFQEKITRQLREIGMVNAVFSIAFTVIEKADSPFVFEKQNVTVSEKGFDQVLFRIIPNAGAEFKAINKIASGGEISRTMLAIKSVLAETDNLPILIFDEIDSGISGMAAQIVGRKLRQLSGFHQLLCITHLPQIAAFASEHICVEKKETEKEVLVNVRSLSTEERVKEIAHLLGGKNISVQALENAQQLIHEANEMDS